MSSPFDTLTIPGLFIYKNSSGSSLGLLFQFNPETLKRSRTVTMEDSSTNQTTGSATGQAESGRKYSLKAARWKIDFDLRLDASRVFPKQVGMLLGKNAVGQAVNALTSLASVMVGLRQLEALVEPLKPENNANGLKQNNPPEVDFYWGIRVWKGFVTSLTINETLFSSLLMPMVVEASISMEIIEPMSSANADIVGGNLFHDPTG